MAKNQIIDQKQFKKLMKDLKVFPERVQKNVVVGSTRAGANVARDEIRSNAPKDTGGLAKSFTTKKRRSPKNLVIFSVAPKKIDFANGQGVKSASQLAYYNEYGTQKMKANPFIRPAFEALGDRPLIAARSYFEPRLKKEAQKLKLNPK